MMKLIVPDGQIMLTRLASMSPITPMNRNLPPKPFVELNHLTVPEAMGLVSW
jgi:hypothetical protein